MEERSTLTSRPVNTEELTNVLIHVWLKSQKNIRRMIEFPKPIKKHYARSKKSDFIS